jgi:hypothetical protein
MTWDELLDEYRALGGIAENVRLDTGPFGRGIFPIEPGKPIMLRTPPSLYVAVREIRLQDGRMTADPDRVEARARAFFEAYEEYFGWGAGGREAMWQLQEAWHALPEDVVTSIRTLGALEKPERRFAAPSDEFCMHDFLDERTFGRGESASIVPMVDLVNHSSHVPTYTFEGGMGVHGTFDDEVLVCYNRCDAWSLAVHYGFTATSPTAYSTSIIVGLPRGEKLTIARNLDPVATTNTLRYPKVETTRDGVMLSHLTLGFATAKDLPRAIFRKMMDSRLSSSEADYVFDGIQHHNRTQFINLLRTLRKHEGPLIRTLQEAAINQLETLSAYVGARSL